MKQYQDDLGNRWIIVRQVDDLCEVMEVNSEGDVIPHSTKVISKEDLRPVEE